MRRALAGCLVWLLLAWLAAACSPAPTVTPRPAPTLSPTITSTPTRSPTPTWTPAPTWTNTPPPTVTPSPTPTRLPALVGTPLARAAEPIIESSLPRLGLLAEWGRGRVEGLAYAPNGRQAAVSTPLGVYLYDLAPATAGVILSGPRVLQTGAPAYRLAFSPDSARLVVDTAAPGSGADLDVPPHILQVWDLSGPEPARAASLVTDGLVLALGFSGAGDVAVLLSVQGGSQYQLWSGIDRRLTLNLTGGETALAGALSPDLGLAATRGQRGPVRLWRLSDGVSLATTRESSEAAGPLAFSPDGSLLAVGYPDAQADYRNTNQVRVWRVPREGGELSTLAYTLTDATRGEGAQQALISLDWSPDGLLLAAGYGDQTVHVWRAQPGPVYRRLELASLPRFLAFDPSVGPESHRLATGGLEIWALGGEGQDLKRLAADNDYLPGIYDMRFLNDGSALALAEYGRIDLRSTANGTRLLEITGMDGPVNGLAVYPQGNFLAAACSDGTVRLYRVSDGRYWNQFGDPTFPILAVDFSSNGFWLAASDESMQVRIFRFLDGIQMSQFSEPFVAYRLQFSPNSNQLASLTTSGVQLRGVTGNQDTVGLALQGNVGGVSLNEMQYSPGAEFLALVGNGVVRMVHPQTRSDLYSLYEGPENLPWSLAFSPDNAFLAVGWSDGQVRLYWAQDGAPMASWQAHPSAVRRLAFSNDGRLLASLGNEGAIRIWGIQED